MGIFSFRIRNNKEVQELEGTGMVMQRAAIYARALQSLQLGDPHRLALSAAMANVKDSQCPVNLRHMSQRLLPNPLEVGNSYFGTTWDDDEFLVTQKKSNRPGYELAAAQGALSAVSVSNNSNPTKGKK